MTYTYADTHAAHPQQQTYKKECGTRAVVVSSECNDVLVTTIPATYVSIRHYTCNIRQHTLWSPPNVMMSLSPLYLQHTSAYVAVSTKVMMFLSPLYLMA